jgi:hypothetical protein
MAGPYPNPTPMIIAEQRTRLGEEEKKKANERGNGDSSNGDDATGAPTAAGAAAPRVDRADTALALTGDGDHAAAAKTARSRVARAAGGVRPYEPARVETFTAVVLVLLLAGVVACAAVFPYQWRRDADAAGTKWVRTLAAWSAAEKFPEVDALRPYYPEEAEAPAAAP